MRFSAIFLLLFLPQVIFPETAIQLFRPKRKAKCVSPRTKTEMHYCESESVSLRYTFQLVEIKVKIIPSCAGLPTTIKWHFRKNNNKKPYNTNLYKNKAVFVIAPSDNLLDGVYTLKVTVQEKQLQPSIQTCKLEFMSEPPVIVFVNGRVHNVRSGLPYTIDITRSISKNPISKKIVWSPVKCKLKNTLMCKRAACPQTPKGMKFLVPPGICYESLEFKASVKFHKIKIYAKQTVFYTPLFKPMVEFRCQRNCDMEQNKFTNPRQETIVKLVCMNTCALFNKAPHVFELTNTDNNNVIPSMYYKVKDNVELEIKYLTFKFDSFYKLTANTTSRGREYTAVTYFKTSPKIKPPRCTLKPRAGISMVTVFEVSCEPTDLYAVYYPSDYNVYQALPGGKERLVVSSSYRYFNFVLGSTGQDVETLHISGNDLFYNKYKKLLGTVKLTRNPVTKNHVNFFTSYVDDLSTKGDYSRAVQVINGILHEVKDSKMDKRKLFRNLMKSLGQIAIESINSYNRIGSLLESFYETLKPEHKKQLSGLCKKLSETQLASLKRSLYNVQMDDEAKALMNPMKECANKLLDDEVIQLDDITVTEPPQVVDEPALTEDYPNYDQAFYNKEEEYIKSNAMDTIMNSALATALTINPGDEVEEIHNNTETKIAKEFGKDVDTKQITMSGVDVSMSLPDKKLLDKKITAIVTSYSKNLFKTKMDTKAVDIGIFNMQNSTKKTANVKVKIKFDLEHEAIPKDNYTARAPASRSAWKDPDIEYTMNIHRLNVPKQHVCSADFKKLEAGQKLQIAFTHNRRPRLADFTKKNTYVLDSELEDSHVIACPFKQFPYDSFIYVAVLPHEDLATGSSGNITVDYEVLFASQYCLTYSNALKVWHIADCDITFIPNVTTSKVMCSCNHTTLFSAVNSKVESKLDPVLRIQYESHLHINYVIFIHVAVVFGCYCIALIFSPKRVVKTFGRDKVIFLSDNLKNDRYAYLLVVKTGDFPNAGTTSNVMCQIFAEKCNSKPHVLNYPDPDKKLLQRNCVDWFVLTNGLYLGDILYIELWFDGIGYRPTWFCENIYVIDLQTRKEWYFNVQKCFTLKNDASVEFKIEPTNTYEITENIMTTIIKHSKFHVGPELTWNIFSKSNDGSFSYKQRLTVILSMIYTTYILVILFMYPPIMRIADAYAFGYFQYTTESLFLPPLTSILSCLINLPFVYFFRNSENELNYFAYFKEQKTFPLLATSITWGILIIWIILCMLYLVVFGFFVTMHTTYFWIFATILSILLAIFVVENIYVTVFNIIQARVAKFKINRYDFVGMLKEIENQRKTLFAVFGEMLLRPYFLNHYKHLPREKLLEMVQVHFRRAEVASLFKDFLFFLVYLGLLYALCFANVDQQDYQSNRAMRLMLAGSFFTQKDRMSHKLFTIKDVYNYINYTILPLIHATNWYGNYHTKNAGQMLDFNTKILGVAQLRQQRREQNCNPVHPMNYLPIKCHNVSKIFETWDYNNGSEITYTLGALENYSGEGYIANLGRTLYNSYFVLDLLSKVGWIDINTKVLFIDFWTYNPNYNIFNLIKIIIERGPSGHYVKSESVFTTRLLYSSKLNEVIVIILIVIFILVIIYNTFNSIIKLTKQRRLFFKEVWEIFDLILVVLSIAVCVLYFFRKNLVKKIMTQLVNSDHNQFVNYFGLITIAKANTWISSCLICLSTIRLWKFLRFGVVFRAMERTLWKSSGALFMTFLYQIFIYFIFTFYINMMYGQTYVLFRTYRKTLTTLFLISINFFDNFDHTYLSQYGSEIYLLYTLFLLSSLVFLTIYSTIIILGFQESQIYFSNKPIHYTIRNYWLDEKTYYSEILKRHNQNMRLKGGQDEPEEAEMVYPKEMSKRYADCISMNNEKMRLMRFVALAVIRKRSGIEQSIKAKYMTEDQFKLMARITLCLIKPGKVRHTENMEDSHLFFHGKDPVDNSIRFISNDTLLRMEFAAKYILEPKPPDISFEKNRYVIHVDGDDKRLEYFRDILQLINTSIDNIKIVVSSKGKKPAEAKDKDRGKGNDEIGAEEIKVENVEKLEGKKKKKGKRVTGEKRKSFGRKKKSEGNMSP